MLPLRCAVQNYDWGKEAEHSEVAKIARANGSIIDDSKPFAELWMGTHPKGPSVLSDGATLQSWIEDHPDCLGKMVQKRFGTNLPFLFKVLSVRKALSIQSHPDKVLAQRLRKENPEMYPDDNHKPEMALAICDFEALCGFAPLKEIQDALQTVPEFCMAVGEECAKAIIDLSEPCKETLKAAFTAMMENPQVKVEAIVRSLVARLSRIESGYLRSKRGGSDPCISVPVSKRVKTSQQASKDIRSMVDDKQAGSMERNGEGSICSATTNNRHGHPDQPGTRACNTYISHCSTITGDGGAESDDNTPTSSMSHEHRSPTKLLSAKEQLVLRLNSEYPLDVGILSVFFLNLVSLNPGEAIYLPANEPHAYLKGELVECMAASDNVIRAGLTPKFKHTEVLCESLSYEQGLPHVLKGESEELPGPQGAKSSGGVLLTYRPPFEEFEIQCVRVPVGCSASLPVNQGPTILLVNSGSGSATATNEVGSSQLCPQQQLQKGNITFVPAGTKIEVTASSCSVSASAESIQVPHLTVWIASVNKSCFEE